MVIKSCLAVALVLGTLTIQAAGDKWDQKAQALLAQMTLDEKVGQMVQADMLAVTNLSDIQKYGFGSMLSGGSSDPADITPEGWRKACDEFQSWALKTRLKIPLIYGIDAVHGHNNVDGAVVFPHDIGLGATRNPSLIEKAQYITAQEIAGTGMHWAFGPCVAVAQNPRWGRTYESFGECPDLVSELGAAAVKGMQKPLPGGGNVLACAKHFLGDGGTLNGVDQGNMVCNAETMRKLHLAPYIAAVKAGAGSVMASYSSWDGQKMHGHKYLLTDVLKGELGFKGLVVSDWAGIDQLSPNYKQAVEKSINAGVDMGMIPNGPGQKNNYVEFINDLKALVAEGKVSQARIDDAVRRILRVKYEMGVFDHPYGSPKLTASVGSAEHREVARQCVRESLVLLKNEGQALPLSRKLKQVVVVGKAADDIGIQCGGWTISWQGDAGRKLRGATSILAGLNQVAGKNTPIKFSPDASELSGADTVVVVIGELPYAEMKGDRSDLQVSAADAALVEKAKASGAKVVTVVLSGRPLVLGKVLDNSDALVAAWLPGSEGAGVADVLFGDAKPKGKLSRTWPKDNSQLAMTSNSPSSEKPQFEFGFGLSY